MPSSRAVGTEGEERRRKAKNAVLDADVRDLEKAGGRSKSAPAANWAWSEGRNADSGEGVAGAGSGSGGQWQPASPAKKRLFDETACWIWAQSTVQRFIDFRLFLALSPDPMRVSWQCCYDLPVTVAVRSMREAALMLCS